MKSVARIAFALILLTASLHASFTVNITATDLRNNSGVQIPTDALILLIGDSGNNGFGDFTLANTANLTLGSQFGSGSDDVILFKTGAVAAGVGAFPWTQNIGTFNMETGEQVILVWFPTLSSAATTPGSGQQFGTFRTSAIIDTSTIAWVTPADSTNQSLNVFSQQNAAFVTVPEPSGAITLALGLMGILSARRRRR